VPDWNQPTSETTPEEDSDGDVELGTPVKVYRTGNDHAPLEDQWAEAVNADWRLGEMIKAVEGEGTRFPSELQVRASMSECTISPEGHLLFRSRR
jgi:hypothetical protein